MRIIRLRPWVIITISILCLTGIVYYSYEVILWYKHVNNNSKIQKKIEKKIIISEDNNEKK